MFIIWRFALSIVAAIALGLTIMARRWKVAAVFSIILVAAIAALSVIVTVTQVKEYRGGQATTTHQQQLTPSGLPAGAPAPWQPGGAQDGRPTGAAAPSPQ